MKLARYIDLIAAKGNEVLCQSMGFEAPELHKDDYECYLAFHAPKWQKPACVTIDLFNGEVDCYCENDEPRQTFLINDVAMRLGGRFYRNYRRFR